MAFLNLHPTFSFLPRTVWAEGYAPVIIVISTETTAATLVPTDKIGNLLTKEAGKKVTEWENLLPSPEIFIFNLLKMDTVEPVQVLNAILFPARRRPRNRIALLFGSR